MNSLPRYSTTTVGTNKNAPRVWLEGKYLLTAGFLPTKTIEVEFSKNQITITLNPSGSRKVSSQRDGSIPVLDLNSNAIADAFGAVDVLQVKISEGCITLTPTETERLRASRCYNGKEGSLFSGGGLLTEAARQAGYQPAFAVEIDERYAEVYEENHPEARMYNLSIEQVPLDSLPPVELLTMGLPCQPFSRSRTRDLQTGAKRDRNLPPEAHPLSDMLLFAANVIHQLNPATIIIEQAPGFLTSASGHMLMYFLKRIGYTAEARVIDPREYGELTARTRTVIVAHSGSDFEWPSPLPVTKTFADIRDDETFHEKSYFTAETKPWLTNHWEKQTAKGNGFTSQQIDDQSDSITVLNRRYFAMQGTGAVVKHRSRTNTWRWQSLNEARKLHGLPPTYKLPEAKTTAGEIIGQGVIVTFFEKIISAARRVSKTLPVTNSINAVTTVVASAVPSDQLGLSFT